jgi:hypothetical protein
MLRDEEHDQGEKVVIALFSNDWLVSKHYCTPTAEY